MGSKPKDVAGMTFDRLTALCYVGSKDRGAVWHCRCVCGRELDVPLRILDTKRPHSCGCSRKPAHRPSAHTYCPFRDLAVECPEDQRDCEHCGWSPEVETRRKAGEIPTQRVG